MASDRCELFYHQASAEGGFLTLAYVRSGKSTSLSTCYAAALVLDEIAATIHRSGKGGNYLMGSMSVRYMRPAETKPIEPTNYWTFTLPQ